MRFEVLGPVRAVYEPRPIAAVSALRRRLLAVLLVRANRAVGADVLAEVLWGDALPERPDKSLQVHVYRLRQVLDRSDRLVGVPGGYLLEVAPDELDATEFARLLAGARRARESDDLDSAVASLREGLALWRGAPYADVDDGVVVGPEARRLAEVRLIAREELYEAELARGRAREVVPELSELVATYPLRERFVAQLMLALYRSGRQARAIAAYRTTRRRLKDDLGAEPGLELRELYDAMRAEDPRLLVDGLPRGSVSSSEEPASGPSVPPSQLPPAPGAFVGRHDELAALDHATQDVDDSKVVVIAGTAGVGKTGLALRYAHEAADRFGDGQLYLDLRGHASGPALEPLEALGHLLRGLGAEPGRVAGTVPEATAEYRSLIAGRKMLVVLDNAASAEQVRPLLPATPGCLTVITSRNKLSGLVAREGAQRMGLDVLPADDARTLLDTLLGAERTDAEPEQAAALIDECARLPLALRIAAAQLCDEPHRTLGDYVTELREGGLATLALDDDEHSAVATAFDLSYRRLDADTRHVFRLLGLVPGPDFTVDAAAATTGLDAGRVRVAIRRLMGAHLAEEHASGRYRCHDLMREYARSRGAAEDSPAARHAALERLFAWYYQGKRAAQELLVANRREPPAPELPRGSSPITFDDTHDASGWLSAELDNISAAVRAADGALRPWAWHLTIGLAVAMTNRGYVDVALPLTRSAVDAARAADDLDALAYALTEQGAVRFLAGLPVPDDVLAEALRLTEATGNDSVHGYCLNLAGIIDQRKGDLEAAERHLTHALAAYRRAGDDGGLGLTLNNLGAITYLMGDLRRTESTWLEILELQGARVTMTTPIALANLIWVRTMLGQVDGIDDLVEQAQAAVAHVGDPSTATQLAHTQAQWHRERGQYDLALEVSVRAIRMVDEIAQPHLQCGPREELGWCHLARGDLDAARTQFEQVKEIAGAIAMRDSGSAAARGLARTALAAGDLAAAAEHAHDAAELARVADRVGEAESAIVVAMVDVASGRFADAVRHGELALAIHRQTEHHLGQARAHRVLGEALVARGGSTASSRGREHLREALRMFEAFGSPEAQDLRASIDAGTSAPGQGRTAPRLTGTDSGPIVKNDGE